MEKSGVIAIIGRRLRLAVIGGAPESFIGGMHRMAARLDDQYELVAGVLSSDRQKSITHGLEIGLNRDRAYGSVKEMIAAEKVRADGADVIAIMTPNSTHFEYAMMALDNGFHVICDKPMTTNVKDAVSLQKKVEESGLIFCLTHNYTGYPMTRQAKAMVEHGDLGDIRLVQVEYVQGGKADESRADLTQGPRSWKFNPKISGPSLVMCDIGTHAHNLLRFITGLEVVEVCADVGSVVPGRTVDDFAGALLRLERGARGIFWVTQAAAGVANSLKIRVSGNRGSLEWLQEQPQVLIYKPLNAPEERRTPNGPGSYPLSSRGCRISSGHPEGFPEAFANLYSDTAEVIASKIAHVDPDPLAVFPTVYDGVSGTRFVDAIIKSSKNNSWVNIV